MSSTAGSVTAAAEYGIRVSSLVDAPAVDARAQVAALVDTVVELRAQIDALEALEARVLAAAASIADAQATAAGSLKASQRDMPLRSIAAEFATALRVGDRTMQSRMKSAEDLVQRFPETYNLWATGRISRRHAAIIHEAGVGIDDADARADYERVAVRAAQVETPGRLGPVAKILAARFDPRTVDEKHAAARGDRRVWIADLDAGMSELHAVLPTILARGVEDRLTQQAKAVIRARGIPGDPDGGSESPTPDTRPIDQVRADLLSDLLLCGLPEVDGPADALAAIRATVRLTIPVLSLLGNGSEPAVLTGSGPIDLETAQRLCAGASGWERVLTSPFTGAVLAVERYQPGADIRRYLDARDEHCRFPGCRQPARRCDRDHTHDHAFGGPTCVCNFEHLCEGHHMLRHATAWSVRQLGGGVLEWTSPLGRTYIDRPEAVVRFVEDGEAPPGWRDLPQVPGIRSDGDRGVIPRGAGPVVSWPPPPDECRHPQTPRDPLLDPWLLSNEHGEAPF